MSVYTNAPWHYNTSILQCQYNQQISEETEHLIITNNGQKKVEYKQTQ